MTGEEYEEWCAEHDACITIGCPNERRGEEQLCSECYHGPPVRIGAKEWEIKQEMESRLELMYIRTQWYRNFDRGAYEDGEL